MSTKQLAVDAEAARTLAWLARFLESELGELELSLPQYRLLTFLDRDDWAASALADRLAVSRPSVTSLADGLVAKGLIERRPSEEDRRRVLHVLTKQGRAALAKADRALQGRLDGFLERLDDEARSAAVDGLAALTQALVAARDERYGRLRATERS